MNKSAEACLQIRALFCTRHEVRSLAGCASLRYDVAPQRCVDILRLRCKGTKKNSMYKIFVHTLTLNFHHLSEKSVVFNMHVEARTILVRIVPVSVNAAMINLSQLSEQLQQ